MDISERHNTLKYVLCLFFSCFSGSSGNKTMGDGIYSIEGQILFEVEMPWLESGLRR